LHLHIKLPKTFIFTEYIHRLTAYSQSTGFAYIDKLISGLNIPFQWRDIFYNPFEHTFIYFKNFTLTETNNLTLIRNFINAMNSGKIGVYVDKLTTICLNKTIEIYFSDYETHNWLYKFYYLGNKRFMKYKFFRMKLGHI
jgi:hypothetical protein